MPSVALLPSMAILAGVCAGVEWAREVPHAPLILGCVWIAAVVAWARHAPVAVVVFAVAGYALAGMILGSTSAKAALAATIRAAAEGSQAPVTVRARLLEDAAPRDFGVSLLARVEEAAIDGPWHRVDGGVRLTVSGSTAADQAAEWRAGRMIEAPATLRRPARYLNEGVPDFERDLALRGVALTGGVKSGLLVQVVERGGVIDEIGADVRAHVRSTVRRRVAVRDPVAAAIVTAILIGDRTALPEEVRSRLQAAGTYHVIAISGGNIAILAALMAGALLVLGANSRISALAIIGGLTAYALVVSAGPSVWRATTTAVVYFAARLVDHRSPPWNAMAVSAALLACVTPLDVRDAGFALTFGATAAILEAARRVRRQRMAIVTWLLATVVASLATEVVLLPIGATVFYRVTVAGLALNLLAIPLMTVAQIAGLLAVGLDRFDSVSTLAGIAAAAAARGLIESARLVELLPWLAVRVPPPPAALVATYYAALGSALWLRRGRSFSVTVVVLCFVAMVTGVTALLQRDDLRGLLRLTMFDVGQGDALLLQTPAGRAVMVDTGGAGFDGTAFDIGGRVLAPALWARGVLRLDALAITHADPDHIGGAVPLVRDFAPSEIWEGIQVAHHGPSQALLAAATASGAIVRQRLSGWYTARDDVQIRVLHPPAPDWDRPRVRNDDSLVMEVRYGDVAMLLTGDIGAEVERSLLESLLPARIRILKVAHHGSRTSTSQALLDAWKPDIALISCGRDNRFGHPAPEVVRRLEAAGTRIYRTDRDGQITLETDGVEVGVRTFVSSTKVTKP